MSDEGEMNIAFVDGQNLHMGTAKRDVDPWRIDLTSGDGDYKLLVDFLIEENRFEKILFPDRKRASSLYKRWVEGIPMLWTHSKFALR